jgi:hypothetical protein
MPSSSGLATASSAATRARSTPAADRGAHHRLAHLAHHRAHVFEVDVDQPRHVDDFGNAAHGVAQHVVGGLEGLQHADFVAQHFLQLLVEDHDQ